MPSPRPSDGRSHISDFFLFLQIVGGKKHFIHDVKDFSFVHFVGKKSKIFQMFPSDSTMDDSRSQVITMWSGTTDIRAVENLVLFIRGLFESISWHIITCIIISTTKNMQRILILIVIIYFKTL